MVSMVAIKQILYAMCSNLRIFLIGVRVRIKPQLLLPSLSRRRWRHFKIIIRRFEFVELSISLLIVKLFSLAIHIC